MNADLVLEGGGVKGIAHVGAISVLEEAGYTFPRVAGASAGSLVAAFVAAGVKAADMKRIMLALDFAQLPHATGVARVPLLGKALSVAFDEGIYDGDHLRRWVADTLASEAHGTATFRDLRITDDPGSALSDNQQYKLVVMVTDVSRGQLIRLPWDYGQYGLDADDQSIADAIRASTSIPFFFKPAHLRWGNPPRNVSVLVDGGACSDFPIEVFDRTDGTAPRWPTFGIKLSARPAPGTLPNNVHDTLSFTEALLETIVNGNDQVHLADPCVSSRTIFIDTSAVASTDFALDQRSKEFLYTQGVNAARDFLDAKPWLAVADQCAQDAGREPRAQAARGEENPAERTIAERATAP